ncbi:MAG: glycosyltransferase [Candidatus Omnitrophica bacterium]|nr:glycosyltransferase [Candidatus Omnitrophota bacterium]
MKVNIAILNYNGKGLLEECLPSIIEAAENSVYRPKVTVLDNRSTDGSIEFIKERFPGVGIYIARENKVYCSYNEFFNAVDDDVIFVLNSDIKTDKDFIDPVIRHFEKDPEVFFVSSRMYYFDGVTYQGDLSRAVERFGVFSADSRFNGFESMIDKENYTFSTGNGAFDRKKYLKLGGYDEIYLPGRYEDVDLCYRAWKAGFKGIYEPASVIFHKGYASFKSVFSDEHIERTVFRNSLLFMVKNFSDPVLLSRFYFWLPIRLAGFILTGRFHFIRGFWEAAMKAPGVMARGYPASADAKLSDRKVLEFIGWSHG